MTRTTTKSNLGDGQKLYTVNLLSPPCEALDRGLQVSLLKSLADTPELQKCGDVYFTKLRMAHDGIQWVITMEAVGP